MFAISVRIAGRIPVHLKTVFDMLKIFDNHAIYLDRQMQPPNNSELSEN